MGCTIYMLTLTLCLMKRTVLQVNPGNFVILFIKLSFWFIPTGDCVSIHLCLENAAVESGTVDLTCSSLQVFWRLISPCDKLGTNLHQQQTSSEEPFYAGHLVKFLLDPLPIQCALFLQFQGFSANFRSSIQIWWCSCHPRVPNCWLVM